MGISTNRFKGMLAGVLLLMLLMSVSLIACSSTTEQTQEKIPHQQLQNPIKKNRFPWETVVKQSPSNFMALMCL